MDAPISLHWHYPSFSTPNVHLRQIADPGNKCTVMLLKAGFDAERYFWYNNFSRREARVNGKKVVIERRYSKETIEIQRSWVSSLRDNMHAKVEIVFGTDNKNYMKGSLVLEDLAI